MIVMVFLMAIHSATWPIEVFLKIEHRLAEQYNVLGLEDSA